MIFVKLAGYGVSANMVLNETKVVTRPAELVQQSLCLSIHPKCKTKIQGMFYDLKRYDMGLFFVKKLVGYGYDFCLFYVIPELRTLHMSSVRTTGCFF